MRTMQGENGTKRTETGHEKTHMRKLRQNSQGDIHQGDGQGGLRRAPTRV
jgi:hypothetical protein